MLEQKFQEFIKKLTPKEFNDVDFLEQQAESIRSNDNELADRILVRVRNLRKLPEKNQQNVKENTISKSSYSQPKEIAPPALTWQQKVKRFTKTPFVLCVVVPSLIFAFYQLFWATDRYESSAQVIIQQPDSSATMDASFALLSGLGVSSGGRSDPQLLETYINSNDMLTYLNKTLQLKKYYSEPSADVFSRLAADAKQEDFLDFYQKHISVEVDETSSVISVSVQAFDPIFAEKLAQTIVARSEWYINNIGYQLAKAQVSFIKQEHQTDEDKLKKAQVTLLGFQQKYHLLDPTVEGAAMQRIAYTIQGQVAAKEAELKGLSSIMSNNAPQVLSAKNDLEALKDQLLKERNKLSKDNGKTVPVSEILSKYADLKISMELALQSYTSSKVSLEKSRIEAYRKIKYLITVQSATLPEKSKYPDAPYNISLFALLAAMLFAVVRIVYSIVRELR